MQIYLGTQGRLKGSHRTGARLTKIPSYPFKKKVIKQDTSLLYGKVQTLEYEINVPVRLLISQIFSHRYAFISDGTFMKLRFSQI